jgi:hypothetical protein
MFIILPSSNECKAYLTLAPFTVVSAYIIVNKSFCCVVGHWTLTSFKPTIQDLYTAVISQHLDLTLLYADWTCREINSLTHSHLVVLILFP